MIIDCKNIAKKIYGDIKKEISSRGWKFSSPTLGVILVWENSPSMRYINQKRKFCEKVWMKFVLQEFPLKVTQWEILEKIQKWNKDDNISGYIVQLPLPDHISEMTITENIEPEKDVDWFHPMNKWKVLIWDKSALVPCTPAWVMEILKQESLPLHCISGTPFEKGRGTNDNFLLWKQVVVIGKSNLVGKPLVALLMNQWATVVSCNSKTPDISFYTKKADIVISATWVPWLVTKEMIGTDTIVVDVWFSVVDGKIFWDAETDQIHEAWNSITSVPGGVGTLTVAMLLQNTLNAWKLQNNI